MYLGLPIQLGPSPSHAGGAALEGQILQHDLLLMGPTAVRKQREEGGNIT